jgi:LPS sulfotransferase NodH
MKNFIVVGTQRTGSSAIAETLGLHPMVTCGWEWTVGIARHKKITSAKQGMESDFSVLNFEDQAHMATVHNDNKVWLGFRWLFSASWKWIIHPRFSPALWMDRLEDFIKWVHRYPNIHIIHVVRGNNIDWLKSVYLARKTNLYSKKKYPDGLKVYIPEWEALYRIRAKKWIDERLNTIKGKNPFLCIEYEDFLNNPNAAAAMALNFLHCDETNVKLVSRSLKKQSKGKNSDYILNYNGLVKKLSKKNMLYSFVPKVNKTI